MTLKQSLITINSCQFEQPPTWKLSQSYYSPSFWVNLVAISRSLNDKYFIQIEQPKVESFVNTIGFNRLTRCSATTITVNHPMAGKTYCPIQSISDSHDVDPATNGIASCFNHYFSDPIFTESGYLREMWRTIGELHDNVSAHSKAQGFSMAQTNGENFEFSIADYGIGFLREINNRKSELPIETDKQAIEWCLQRGNTTKKSEEFDQQIPSDLIGPSPMIGARRVMRTDGSHHQGLGLFNLKEFAKTFGGRLEIASGEGYYNLAANGVECYEILEQKFSGVAITMCFNLSDLDSKVKVTKEKMKFHQSINIIQ